MTLKLIEIVIKLTGNIMALTVNTNVASLNAQRQLLNASNALSNSLTRLSSGLRISSAGDPSALTEAMRSKTNESAASRNSANEVMGSSQIVEGGLTEATSVLVRLRELTVQSLNGTSDANDLDALNEEFSRFKSEAVRIAQSTSHKGEALFVVEPGTTKNITFGSAQLDQRQFALLSNGDPDDGILTRSYDGFSLTSDAFDISSSSSVEQRNGVLQAIDGMLSGINTARYAIGSFQNEIDSQVDTALDTDPGLYTSARSRDLSDLDFEAERSRTKDAIKQMAGSSILSQANSLPNGVLSLLRG